MRRLAILATVFSLSALACDRAKPKPEGAGEAEGEADAKTLDHAPTPDPVTSFDATKVCDRQATLLEAQMKEVPEAPQPPPDWREPYVAGCAADMKTRLESDRAGTLAYAQCLDKAESSHHFAECQADRELARRKAVLAGQTRAPLPDGADSCRVDPPTVRGAPQPPAAPHVQISSKAICVDDTPVVAMLDGAIDPDALEGHWVLALGVPLRLAIVARRQDPLTPEIYTQQGTYEPVKLSIDKSTSFATIIDVVYTVLHEEGSEVWYAARTEAGGEGFLPLSPPVFTGLDGEVEKLGRVMITQAGLIVRDSAGAESTLALADPNLPITDPARWDLAALETTLAKIEAKTEEFSFGITAENAIPFEIVAKVIDVMRGPECPVAGDPQDWTPDNCRFPRVVIEAGAG